MDEGVFLKIVDLMGKKIGINAASLNKEQWVKLIRTRMEICQIGDLQEYYAKLEASAIELQELIELIVVPETWFFRDWGSFDFLRYFVVHSWLGFKMRSPQLKLLSLPCSTGEEPYSIVMTLF